MSTANLIADNLVRGVQVARNLIYRTISEGVEWHYLMHIKGTYSNTQIAYKKEDIKTAPIEATTSIIEELKSCGDTHLVIYPSKKEYIVTLIFNRQEYSIKQPLPSYDNYAVSFPSVEYVYSQDSSEMSLEH